MRIKPKIGLMSKIGLMLSAAVLMSGCSTFPEYIKTAIKLPDSWQAKLPKEAVSNDKLPHNGNVNQLIDWWGQFNDPALNQLLKAAEEDNPTIDIALTNIKSVRASSISAAAQGLPSVKGNASITRSQSATSNSINSLSGISTSTVGALDARWEIDLFGGIKFAKQAAEARVEAKQNDWHTARVSLAAEVATNYVDYRACQLSVTAYQQAMTSKNETSRLTKVLSDAGFSAPADAALAEASLRSTESSLINQQAQCDNTVKALVALTNITEPALREILLTGDTKTLPQLAEFNVESVPANLITQRPDLIADERNLAAASADTGVATANRYPSLSLIGSIGRSKISGNSFSSNGNTWSFGPSLSLPIFDGGQLKSQVTIAEANYAIALATYQQDVRSAVKEVEQTLVNLDSAVRRESAEKISAAQYSNYYKAAEINWRAGGISLITLEDARRQLITAELSHITQQKDCVQYWIALYKVLGGGWQATDSETKKEQPAEKVNTPSTRNVTIGKETKIDNETKSNESKK